MTGSLDSIAADMLGRLMHVKRNACAREGGPTDTVMMLDVRFADGHTTIGNLPDRDLLPFALHQMAETHDAPITLVGILGDVYYRDVNVGAGERPPEHGEIRAAFEAGDMKVREELMVTVYDVATDFALALSAPYVYGDDGMPRFRAAKRFKGNDVQGQIIDYVREALR